MAILITGGCGYIGAHICVSLLNHYNVIVIDSHSKHVIDNINKISHKPIQKFYNCNLLNITQLENIFENNNINTVIHLAGFKSVNESILNPLLYYHNNVVSTINLLNIMKKYNCKNFIFSSSATVYGNPNKLPITESFPIKPINPYGRTKVMIEQILQDLYNSDNDWKIINLRYFNPIGSHESGLINEQSYEKPNNLLPYIIKVIKNELPYLNIYGNDYDTKDGTCIRDYIYIGDLADGHLASLKKILGQEKGLYEVYNLGTGRGYSVLEIIKSLEKYTKPIPYQFVNRREGDAPVVYTDNIKAKEELKWSPGYNIDEICKNIINNI